MGFSQVAKGGPDGSLCLGYAIALDRYRDSPEHARLWAIDRLHFLCRKVCDKVARSSIYFREPHGLDLQAGQCNFAIGSARKGLSRECGASVATDNAAAAPATVSGEPIAIETTGITGSWEGGLRQ